MLLSGSPKEVVCAALTPPPQTHCSLSHDPYSNTTLFFSCRQTTRMQEVPASLGSAGDHSRSLLLTAALLTFRAHLDCCLFGMRK